MHQHSTTYSRIVSFLIAVGCIVLVLFSIEFYFKSISEKQVIESSKVQFNHEVNALVEMDYSTMAKTAYDYSFWGEFVSAIEHKDQQWCKSNITFLTTFKYDFVCIYDDKRKVLCEFDNVGGQFKDLIPKGVLDSCNKTTRPHFFLTTRLGLIEVTYTSVHPPFDIKHGKPQPSGYLYVGRLWNREFLANLSEIIGAPAHLTAKADLNQNTDPKSIQAYINLPNWDGSVSAIVVFTKTPNHSFRESQYILYFTLLF